MNDMKNFDRLLEIKSEIKDLTYFIDTVCDLPEKSNYFNRRCLFNLKIKHDLKLSVFGLRFFNPGIFRGTHEQEIKVPYTIIPYLKEKALDKVNELKTEVESL